MANVSVTNTFVANTTASASEVNQDFTDLVNFINGRNDGSASWDGLKVDSTTLVVDTSGNRVGIGTATPDQDLEIEGSAATIHQDASASCYHYIDRGTTSTEGLVIFQTAGTNKCAVGLDNDTTDHLYFFTGGDTGTPKAVIQSTGRVGIGTTSPSDLLEISGSDDIIAHITATGADSRAYLLLDNDANTWKIDIEGADSDKLRILDGSENIILTFAQSAGEIVFNEGGIATLDVRMESDSNANLFLLDSSENKLFLGGTTPGSGTVQYTSGGGLVLANATGGDKGSGTANFAGDIYKNDTAYTNPDYALEYWATGKVEKFKDNPGASDYIGILSLDDLSDYCKKNYALPRVKSIGADESGGQGVFARADALLEKVEEAYMYIFQLHERLKVLETV